MLRLTVITSLLYTGLAICPSGFDLVRNGECYKQIADQRNVYAPNGPSTVKSECANFAARPVFIKNQEDHDYWVSVGKTDHQSQGANAGFVLLGIECNADEHWQWTDGTSVDFRPDNYDPDLIERCNINGQYCMWTINPQTSNWQKWCNMYHMVDEYCIIAPDINPVEPDPDCGSFSDDDDDDICYQVGITPANWTEASTICHSFGANVASVHNDQENNFIRRLAISKGLVNGMMLGATGKSKKSFKWADGMAKFPAGRLRRVSGNGNEQRGRTVAQCGLLVRIALRLCQTEAVVEWAKELRAFVNADAKVPACDGGLKQEGDIIYSPGFPTSSSEPCDFLLKVDPGMLVEVEILFLEANECCDHLVLFEGTLGGPLIADLSGEDQCGRTFRTTSQNVMRASWQPNGGVNVKGMMITFRGVYPSGK